MTKRRQNERWRGDKRSSIKQLDTKLHVIFLRCSIQSTSRMMRLKGTNFISILLTSHCMQTSSFIPLLTYCHRGATIRMPFSTRSKYSIIHSSRNILPLERPPDPSSKHSNDATEAALQLRNWMQNKKAILCLTGAGMSTESGIPDYRGHKGSYFNGHKPVSMVFIFVFWLVQSTWQ